MALGDLVGISTSQGVRAYDNGDGTFTLQVQTTAGVPTTTVITKYVVATAFAVPAPGGSVGDIVQSIATYNTATGAIISTIWTNITTGLQYPSAPPAGDLTQQASADPYGTQFFSYTANTGSTGVSVGDFIQRAVSTNLTNGSAISTWYNITTGLQLTGGNIPPVANLTPASSGGGGGGGAPAQQVEYTAIAGGPGYVLGDVISELRIFDPSTNPATLISTAWYNVTQGVTITAPAMGNLVAGNNLAATAANQVTGNNTLTAISNKLPASLGAKTSAASLSTVLATDAALPLPLGAATSSLQTTGNTLLSDIATDINAVSAQLPVAIGPQLAAGSLSVVMGTGAALPLPTGAATAANQATEIASLATIATKTTATAAQLPASLGSQTSAASLSTVLASDATLPLPTGAATSGLQITGNTTLSAISNKLPPALGLQTAGNSLSVVVANGAGGNSEVGATALYTATAASPGEYAIGDILQEIQIYTPGTPSTLLDTIWNNLTQQTVITVVPAAGDITPVTNGGAVSTNIVATSTYAVKTAGSGYAVGDTLQEVIVYDPTGATVITTTWNNLSQGTVLGAAPVYANITATNSQLPPALGPQSAADSLSVYVQNPATGSSTATNSYIVTTGWTDGVTSIAVNDIIQNILVFNTSGALTTTIWYDVTQAYTLLAPPPAGNIDLIASSTATSANQLTQITEATTTNTNLTTISSQLPTTLGQKLSAASLSTVLASDATLPLPTGAATAARQDTGNTSLASIATQSTITANNTGNIASNTATITAQLPTVIGQTTNAASLSVALASDTALPLPTGAATAALQSTGNTSLGNIDTSTAAIDVSTASIDTKLPPALGPQLAADSLSVVIANQTSGDVATGTEYTVVNAWTGTSVGDAVLRYSIFTPGATPPTLVSETWFNLTAGTTLATGPASYADVTISASNTVTPVLPQVTPSLITTSTTGTVAAGAKQISFANTGTGTAIIGSATLPSGASLDFTAPSGSSIAALSYDATGTSLLIATLV